MSKELTIQQKKEWAQMLYLSNQYTQKEIAAKVRTSEKTMSKWAKQEHWEKLRKSLLTTKSEILAFLYNVLDNLKNKIAKEDGGIGDTKLADMVVKYTAAIKTLETETSVAQLMEAGRKFHKWYQHIDPKKAMEFLNNYDAFIKDQLKQF